MLLRTLSFVLLGTLFACGDKDLDGDGIPETEDCDDNDPNTPSNDADCDGVPTDQDCNDNSTILLDKANDNVIEQIVEFTGVIFRFFSRHTAV